MLAQPMKISSKASKGMLSKTANWPRLCIVCNTYFKSSELREHMKTHEGEVSHMCPFCFISVRSSDMPEHMKSHTGEKPYICLDCNVTFKTKTMLKFHKRRGHGYSENDMTEVKTHLPLKVNYVGPSTPETPQVDVDQPVFVNKVQRTYERKKPTVENYALPMHNKPISVMERSNFRFLPQPRIEPNGAYSVFTDFRKVQNKSYQFQSDFMGQIATAHGTSLQTYLPHQRINNNIVGSSEMYHPQMSFPSTVQDQKNQNYHKPEDFLQNTFQDYLFQECPKDDRADDEPSTFGDDIGYDQNNLSPDQGNIVVNEVETHGLYSVYSDIDISQSDLLVDKSNDKIIPQSFSISSLVNSRSPEPKVPVPLPETMAFCTMCAVYISLRDLHDHRKLHQM